jgi:phosphodiesterase/alkaline phosphatase D-like protein
MSFSSWLRGLARQLVQKGNGRRGRRQHRPHRFRPAFHELEARVTPTISFLGVAAGDATSSDAILWTRAQDSTTTAGVPVKALVSTDPAFRSGLFYSGTTDATQDYTIHLDATGLQSGTTYYYQFVAPDGTLSQAGTFKTAPAPTADVGVHFGFTGDADGLMRPYDATSNVTAPGVPSFAQQNFDYFTWLGDTIYETASGSPSTDNVSPAVPSSSTAANINSPAALATMEQAYWTKYKQQLQPVNTGPYPGLGDNSAGLQGFFDSTGHYTLLDNHELGNKQVINGGAPAYTGTLSPTNPNGIGVDASNPAFDVNTTGTYMNQSPVFQTLEQAYYDYQPIRMQTVNAPGDPRSNGTEQLYFSQQWGANSAFFNLDDRSYRDIRLKTPSGADDTGIRADNPGRTMLGQTELAWVEQGLLAAQNNGTVWKIVAISSPIDQIGPIGGSFTIDNTGDPNTTQPGFTSSESDGGKSWMGGYRFERNELLKFIADNNIQHVVFLSTDDHQVRINELGYFTQFDQNGTPIQSSYTRVPGAFEIVVGPIGATGPDTITDHSTANIQALAQSFASHQQALGLDPIGLDPNFPGLINVSREGDSNANANRSAFDFYSPDTFNYASLSIDPTGHNLTVTIDGINSYAVNTFPQPNANNPVRQLMQFTITTNGVQGQANSFNNLTEGSATVNGTVATFTDPNTTLQPGNLLVSESTYSGSAGTVSVGSPLPGAGGLTATANGAYPTVFNNDLVDGSFGVTSPVFLNQLTTSGAQVGSPINVTAALGNTFSTSFSSKSELALNLSADGTAVTFMGYQAPTNALDVSNSNTQGVIDPTNLDGLAPDNNPPSQRAVAQIDANGDLQVTPVNSYSGNNGRAAILGSTGDYYLVGNAGNGGFTIPGSISTNGTTTVTLIPPAGSFTTTAILAVGDLITGKFIPAGATVSSIIDGTHFTISAPAATGTDNKAKIVQSGTTLGQLSDNTGVQMVVPGGGPNTTVVGQVNGTFGSSTGYQRGFSITNTNPLTGQPYSPTPDKTGKDDNFRGETIFNNTLYVTKGSGGNGIDTVYQVGTAGSLPTLANAGTTPFTVLPGFPSGLAANISASNPSTEFFPFGIWFANATTLYVADEGSGNNTASDNPTNDPNSGLEKWSLVNGVWQLDYTLQSGLNLGVKYSVANGPNGEVYPTALDPATDGLRNLTGKVNGDGTVTLYAITSTVSASGDQGADPNKLVAITDNLSLTTAAQAAGESFTTLKTARYGEILRGVSFTPNPTLDHYTASINWGDGTPATPGTVSLAGSTFSVAGSHTYPEEGDYPIKTTITHQGISTTVTGMAHVADAPLMPGTFSPPVATEGAAFSGTVFNFTDTDLNGAPGDYTATVVLGDSHTVILTSTLSADGQIVAHGDGSFDVNLTHTYAEELANQTFSVTVTDHNETTGASTSSFGVADAALNATGKNIAGLQGASTLTVTVATFTDLGGPEAKSDYSATIDWGGAGTGSTTGTIVANGDGSFSVQGSFTYAREGIYTVKVHIVHENGITADTTSTATIKDNIGILLLDKTGKGALNDSGNGNITVTGGGAIVVDSSNSKAAIVSGNGQVSAAEIDAAGTSASGHGAFTGPVDNNEAPLADPLANLSAPPVPSVVRSTKTLNVNSDTTLQPGLYIGGIKISGKAHVVLAPGIYYLQGGGFSVSGQATVTDNGQGVLLYNAPTKNGDGFTFGGQGDVNLTGLSAAQLAGLGLTGPQYAGYLGLAIFQDPNSTAALTLSGQGNVNIMGTVYAAGAAVNISGGGSLNLVGSAEKKFAAHLIVADLTVSGNGGVSVDTSNNNLELL